MFVFLLFFQRKYSVFFALKKCLLDLDSKNIIALNDGISD